MKARIDRWLAPQERFDALRARLGPAPLADLAYANAWDGPAGAFTEAIEEVLSSRGALDLQYTPYGGARVARRVAADDLSAVGVEYEWRDVVLTPGAMAGLHLLMRSLAGRLGGKERGNVVIPVPCWLDHPLYAEDAGLEVRLVPRRNDLALDLDAIADAVDDDTVAFVLAQPCNPTGRVHDRATFEAVSAILGARWWISDECHRDFAHAPVSPASLHANTALVYSYGKRLHVQGQRLGAVATKDVALTQELVRNLRVGGYGMPTALMQRALPRLVDVRADLAALDARRARAVDALSERYEVAESHGTFFLYVRPREGGEDWAITEALASRGVLVLPSALFHHAGWVRLSLSADDAMVDRALEVMR